MPRQTYQVGFLERTECAPGLVMLRFELPADYSFQPGQYVSLTLDTRDGSQTEQFTQSEAPADPYMEITTRVTGSAFKDALMALKPGELATVSGPFGSPMLAADSDRIAFLVGGVGVTPARSIARDAVRRGTGLRIAMFFGNNTEDCIPFREELDSYAAADPAIEVVHVIEKPGPGWTGERGFITADVVRRHLDRADEWPWIVVGPPAMIRPMHGVLDELGVPKENVRTESFGGYD